MKFSFGPMKFLYDCFKVDYSVIKDVFKGFMDNPVEFFVTRPDDGKWLCALLSIFEIIFVALAPVRFSTFVIIIIAVISVLSSLITALMTDGIKRDIVKSYPVEAATNGTARWSHLQYTLSIVLFASNFFSLVLQIGLATTSVFYLFTAILTALMTSAYFLEALAAPRIADANPDEEAIITNGEEAV